MSLPNIKTQIEQILKNLETAGTLREVQVDDFSKNLTERDIARYPAAILTSPQIESNFFTNAEHLRTYTFVILILLKAEDITGAAEVEELQEAILDAIDQEYTLSNEADGGVEPSVSNPGPLVASNKSLIAFTVTIRAKATKGFQ